MAHPHASAPLLRMAVATAGEPASDAPGRAIEQAVDCAVRAASVYDSGPWEFHLDRDHLAIRAQRSRLIMRDPAEREFVQGAGAGLFNVDAHHDPWPRTLPACTSGGHRTLLLDAHGFPSRSSPAGHRAPAPPIGPGAPCGRGSSVPSSGTFVTRPRPRHRVVPRAALDVGTLASRDRGPGPLRPETLGKPSGTALPSASPPPEEPPCRSGT